MSEVVSVLYRWLGANYLIIIYVFLCSFVGMEMEPWLRLGKCCIGHEDTVKLGKCKGMGMCLGSSIIVTHETLVMMHTHSPPIIPLSCTEKGKLSTSIFVYTTLANPGYWCVVVRFVVPAFPISIWASKVQVICIPAVCSCRTAILITRLIDFSNTSLSNCLVVIRITCRHEDK